jgi:hypothetical protein
VINQKKLRKGVESVVDCSRIFVAWTFCIFI